MQEMLFRTTGNRRQDDEKERSKRKNNVNLWIWFAICGVTFAIGEYVSKRWAITSNNWLLVVMVMSYAGGSLAWAPIIKNKTELARMGMIWMIVASICTIGLGVLVFREKLAVWQWLGVGLAIIAMVLIARE